jgi:hypothetical protein
MPKYIDDETGITIESDEELNDAELVEAFSTPAKPAQNQPLIDMARQDATKPLAAPPPAATAYDKYAQNLSEGADIANRPGPAQRMAEEERKAKADQLEQRNRLEQRREKFNVRTDHLEGGTIDRALDLPLQLTRGALGLVESIVGLADIPTLGYAGKGAEAIGIRFKDARQELEYLLSPQQQEINRTVAQAKDFSERLEYGIRNPSLILQMLAESAPSMVGGWGIGRGVVKMFPALAPFVKVAEKTAPVVGGAIGEGAITAGQVAEQTRQESVRGTLTAGQAGIASLSGALTGIIGVTGAGVARRLNIVDIDTLLVGGSIKAAVTDAQLAAKKSVLRRAIESMIEEGTFQELPQSGQEQMAQNLAQGKPIMQGVGIAMADGFLAGSVTGFAVGGGAAKLQKVQTKAVDNILTREFNAAVPAQPAENVTAPIVEPVQEAPVVYQPKETGIVATAGEQEVGSYDGNTLTIADDYQGDRIELARQLLPPDPVESVSEGEATVAPQEGENVATGEMKQPWEMTQKEFYADVPAKVEGLKYKQTIEDLFEQGYSQRQAEYLLRQQGDRSAGFADVGSWGKEELINESAGSKRLVGSETVTIYRAVPKGKGISKGDYAFLSKSDAEAFIEEHGKKRGQPEIVSIEVPKDDLVVPIDREPNEVIYAPSHKKIVERAISEGKVIPSEVLKDYPKLLAALIVNQAKAINDAIGERGSVDLTPVVDLGRSIYQSGATTFEKFSARIQELVGDAWEKVKAFVRQAWDVVANERGSIDFGKKDGKISDASQQTPSQTGPESVGSVQGKSENEMASATYQAEAQAVEQLKQSQSYQEFESVILGNANFGDTFNEAPLEKFMTKEELRAYRQTGQLSARIEALQVERDTIKAVLSKTRTLGNDLFRAGRKIGALEQLERMREIQRVAKERQAEAKEFKTLTNWLEAMAKTIDSKKTIDPEHRKVIKDVLNHNADALENFILKGLQSGDIFTIPEDQIEMLRENRWENTTEILWDRQNQVSIIKQLIYQGRAARTILVGRDKMERAMAILDMTSNIRSNFGTPELDRKATLRAENYVTAQKDVPTIRRKLSNMLTSMVSVLRKGEYIINNLCAYDENALFKQATFGRAVESERVRTELDNAVGPMVKKAFDLVRDEYQSGAWDSQVEVTAPNGEVETFERKRMVSIALNSGCEDNRRAMRDGNDLSDEMIDAVVDALTPAEKAFVEEIWAVFKWQLPHLQKAYKDMNGEDMVLVQGVYYPMLFDRTLSSRLADAMADQNLMQLFGTAVNVNKGRTMTRTGGREALDLDVMRCLSAMDETNHFIAYGQMVRDVNRILSNRQITSAVSDAIGEPYNVALKNWLRRIANPRYDYQGAMPGVDRFMGWLRNNATSAILGWALSTAAMQPTAISQTINRLGVADTFKGFSDFYSDWGALKEFCLASSPWLAGRIDATGDITLKDAMAKDQSNIWSDQGSAGTLMKQSFFSLIKMADSIVTIPTWYAAYQVEFGKSQDHKKAVDFADMTTRDSQSSSSAKDLAEIQGGTNTRKIFVMFYSYFSTSFNEMTRSIDLVKHGKIGMLDLMRSYMWLVAVPSIMAAVIKSRGWSDEDEDPKKKAKAIGKDIAREMVGYTASSVPVIGSVINSLVGGYDFRPTPVSGAVESIVRGSKSLGSKKGLFGGRNDQMPTWMREGGMVVGYLSGMPSRQIMRTADEVWKAVHDRRVTWKNAYGLVYKEQKKKK